MSAVPHEYDPPAFYTDYQQSRPASRSSAPLMPPAAHSGCGDDDDERTDLATSNSLTSLTPVDEIAGSAFPPCTSGWFSRHYHFQYFELSLLAKMLKTPCMVSVCFKTSFPMGQRIGIIYS